MRLGTFLLSLVLAAAAPLGAQEPHADSVAAAEVSEQVRGHGEEAESGAAADIITPHIIDSRHLEVPYWKPPFVKEVELPEWEPVHIGPLTLDLSPTKHVVMLLIAAVLCAATLITAAAAHKRHSHRSGAPRGFAARSTCRSS